MSGRRTLLHTTLTRVTVGLVVAAAGVFFAPLATADPATEADDAITAAYDGTGGPTGPLGVRDGAVYPVGEGFGQNFAAGEMFFTPATGAHWMQGAVLEKYQLLGGPADSDLGFPTLDEGPGRVGPDSRNVTFSAADRPVIFWTPATGAHVVRGAINAAWDRLGGSAGVLGVPTEDEVYRGDVASQKFTAGQLSWNRNDKTFTTVPPELADQLKDLAIPEDATSAIATARRAAGGALGPLGAKEGPQYEIGDQGVGQDYTGGKIFYTPQTGANVVTGQVLAKYESVGGPEGDLGFPISNEADGGLGSNSRISAFAAADEPVIFWTPDYGAVVVRGAMNAGWSKLDGARGPLGAPVADQTENGDVITQRFSQGVLSYDRSTGRFSSEPANLAAQLAGLTVPGEEAPRTPAEPQPSAAEDGREGSGWRSNLNWWWLLALVPVLLVVGLVAGGMQRRRRRDDRHGAFGDDDDIFADAARYRPADGGVPDEADGDEGHDRYPGGYGEPQTPVSRWTVREDSVGEVFPASPRPAPGPDDLFGGQIDPDSIDTDSIDTDSIDTAPTCIDAPMSDEAGAQSWLEEPSLPAPTGPTTREPAAEPVGELAVPPTFVSAPFVEDAPSGRHAAVDFNEPTPGRTAIRLPVDDSGVAPSGYPVKADTKTGLYWVPGSRGYHDAGAEIYFASEEFARTNGFVRGD